MTTHDYADRMNKVLGYIDAHLDAPLNLEALAEVAHFSPFHFHRLFVAWFGETVGDWLPESGMQLDERACFDTTRPMRRAMPTPGISHARSACR